MQDITETAMIPELRKVLKRSHYPLEVMLVTTDKSGANAAAIRSVNDDACVDIELRQSKYLNNIIEQDHPR
jgi:transposase-like protein